MSIDVLWLRTIANTGRGAAMTKALHAAADEIERQREPAEMMQWLIDNAAIGFEAEPGWKTTITFDTADAHADSIHTAVRAAMRATR